MRIASIQLHGVMFGGDEHQFAIHFDTGADRVTMTRFHLRWIVTQMKRQRHLAFDRAFLLVKDHCGRVGQGNVLQADA